MATTFLNLQDRVLRFLGGSSTTARTNVKAFINNAARRWWTRYEWRDRIATGHFSTLAPYSTGTATFTQGSTSVTGSGTTWVAAHTGMKIALGYGSPEYTFTRTGATTGTLDRDYVEDTASASAYVLYQDRCLLATTAEDTYGNEMALHKAGGVQIGRTSRTNGEMAVPFPLGAGTPFWWSKYGMSGGRVQVRLGPYAPDAVYQVRYGYLVAFTELSADSTESEWLIPEKYRQYLSIGALAEAYLMYQRIGEAAQAGQAFEARMREEYARELAIDGASFSLAQAGSLAGGSGITYPVTYP
jgi:hypothetical protein